MEVGNNHEAGDVRDASYHDRAGHRQERVPGARCRRARLGGAQETAGARQGAGVFANLPRCVIGLEACGGAHSLGARAARARARRAPDAAAVRQALRQDQQARCRRRRGVLRGRAAAEHALRAGQDRGPAGDLDAASGARPADRAADGDHQRIARSPGRARDRRGAAPGRLAPAAGDSGRGRGRAHPAAGPRGAAAAGRPRSASSRPRSPASTDAWSR